MKKQKNGFTLIELIAVLVILAIIALIVTPLVMNIVKKAKDSANKRSIDAYGKAAELAVTTYLLDTGDYPTDISSLTIEYSGNEVVCTTKKLNENGSIYLSGCSVSGTEVKDSSTEDGWYHYGKTSAGAYQAYNIGDTVTYNGMNFYVIEASDEANDKVTMLKAEPLTYEEIQNYSAGTDASTYDNNGYGGMQYGNTSEYASSYVKIVVDAWSNDKLNASDLKEDSLGYKTRLLTYDEFENLGYEWGETTPSDMGWLKTENTPSWVYNSQYEYWTMSQKDDSASYVWIVDYGSGGVNYSTVGIGNYVVRPVITLLKSSI